MSQEALIVGGPNGAGKSTFAEAYVAERDLPFLSADAIARRLNPARPAQAKIGAARRFLRELDAHIGRGDDLVVESTLSGRGPRRWLRQMREASYAVSIVFLFVDTPETSIRRVEERVRKGGHHVPNEAVRRRYHRSIRNFWRKYRLLADRWHLYYNGAEGVQRVASGTGERYATMDEYLLNVFLHIKGG